MKNNRKNSRTNIKRYFLVFALLFSLKTSLFSQVGNGTATVTPTATTTTAATATTAPTATVNPVETFPGPLQVGLAIGANYMPRNLYDYYISPVTGRLQRDPISKLNFVGSVVVSYTPLFTYLKTGTAGPTYRAPGWFSILGSFNLAQLNTSTGFNTKLSGGLGLGANIQNIVHIGLFVDFTEVKMLRQSYADSLGKQLVVNNSPLASLDSENKAYFRNDFIPSFSLKLVYIITRRNSDVKSGAGNEDPKN